MNDPISREQALEQAIYRYEAILRDVDHNFTALRFWMGASVGESVPWKEDEILGHQEKIDIVSGCIESLEKAIETREVLFLPGERQLAPRLIERVLLREGFASGGSNG